MFIGLVKYGQLQNNCLGTSDIHERYVMIEDDGVVVALSHYKLRLVVVMDFGTEECLSSSSRCRCFLLGLLLSSSPKLL